MLNDLDDKQAATPVDAAELVAQLIENPDHPEWEKLNGPLWKRMRGRRGARANARKHAEPTS